MFRIYFSILLMFYIVHVCKPTFKGIEMVPERVQIDYLNPKYVCNNASVNVRRSSRGGQYVINLSATNMQLWNNNVSISLYFYEFLHNEYRRTFVENTYKFCDFINNDPYGKQTQKFGVECPLHSKNWVVTNGTITLPSFPYVFPFTKCKVEVLFRRIVPEEVMARGFLYVKIKQI